MCQHPLTQKRTLFLPPFAHSVSESKHVSLSQHIPSLVRRTFPTLTHKRGTRTYFSIPRDAALLCVPQPPVGRVGRACSRAHLIPPCDLPATACNTTTWTRRPSRPSETPRVEAVLISTSTARRMDEYATLATVQYRADSLINNTRARTVVRWSLRLVPFII